MISYRDEPSRALNPTYDGECPRQLQETALDPFRPYDYPFYFKI